VSRRNPARAAQRIAQWIALGAQRWSCWNCRRPIGFVMPGRFFSFHSEREIEVNAPTGLVVRQICDACGAECTYAFTDVETATPSAGARP
jgi:hypothetical protein